MSKHKALELAKDVSCVETRGKWDVSILHQAATTIRAQHTQLVQMRDALESAANGMAELILEVAYKPSTPENIQKVKDAIVTQQPDGPFGDVMRALKAADQYLKDNK